MIPLLLVLGIVMVCMLFYGPFAFRTMSQKRKRIDKYEKQTGTRLSAKDKIRMMK